MSADQAHPQRPNTPNKPLFWLSLAFLCGIILASMLPTTSQLWLLLSSLFLILWLLAVFIRKFNYQLFSIFRFQSSNIQAFQAKTISISAKIKSPLPVALLGAALFFGAWRFQAAQPVISPQNLSFYNDSLSMYIIEGTIKKPPDINNSYINLIIQVDRIRPTYDLKFDAVEGLLLARVYSGGDWHYGDLVRLEGSIMTPQTSEDFSYRDYLARMDIYSYMETSEIFHLGGNKGNPLLSAIYKLRDAAYDTIYNLFPDPEASLLAGILLGVESGIPDPVMDAFNATGTSHIIVISGFNIAVLSALLATLFGRILSRWKAALATLIGITAYTILVGADSAVIRAAVMGGLSLFAVQLGRRQDGVNSLAITAGVMAAANPKIVWDLSFLLSFSATLGLILYAEPLSEMFKRGAVRVLPQPTLERVTGYVSEYVLFTFAAQVVTIPIIAYHFQRISLISLLANPVVLPAQPLLMILGGLAAIFGMLYLPLGNIIAAFAWPFAHYTIRIVESFAQFPEGEISTGDTPMILITLFYAALLLLTFPGETVKEYFSRLKPGIPLGILFLFTIFIWQVALSQPDSRLHLTLLSVSDQGRSGNAIFIQTPTGRQVLIDGGPNYSLLSNGLGRRMPFTNRTLDWLVVAAPNEFEIAALPRTIQHLPPENVLWAGPTHSNNVSRNLWEALTDYRIPVIHAEAGHSLVLGAGAELRTIYVNQRGSVLLLEWKNFRALLPLGTDMDYITKSNYGREIGPINVLLLAENGYIPVNPSDWITNLNPQLVLLSVAADDRSGMPSPETIVNIEGLELLRTDKHGWIHVSTDGISMWCETEKQ